MDRTIARVALLLALTVCTAHTIRGAEVTRYFESSANQKPRGNAGLSVEGDRLRLNADVALRAPDRTQIIPGVTSTVALGKHVGFETRLGGTEWNGTAAPLEHRLDTRLHFRSPAPFLDELEGRVWRSPDGRSGRILKFGFYQKLRDSDAKVTLPLTFRGQATVEATTAQLGPVGAAAGASRRLGVETELAGLMSGVAGRKTLRVKLERIEGGRPASSSSVAYDHGWTVGDFGRVGVNLEMLRASQAPTDGFAPTLNVSWRATF